MKRAITIMILSIWCMFLLWIIYIALRIGMVR